jgi:uncharacterized OsmC-like protein
MQQAKQQEKLVNGVNVTQLVETIDAIKGNPEIAKFNFRATNEWVLGGSNRTSINDYDGACQRFERAEPFVYQKDEPPVLLGTDTGANPVEYVLAGLAGCLTTSLVYHASAQGIQIDEVESTYRGNLDLQGFLGLDDGVRNGYEDIEVVFKVKGNAPEEKLRELVELAQKRSPVFDIVTNKVPVTVRMDGEVKGA